MRANCLVTLASGLLLAQCASKPPEIKTVNISPVQYQPYTCVQLDQEADALSAKAAELSAAQGQGSGPWSAVFRGADAQAASTRLALIKNQLRAIDQTRAAKKCH